MRLGTKIAGASAATIGAATVGFMALGLGGDLTLTDFELSTDAVNVSSSDATVTCTMTITDGGGTPVLDAGCTIVPPSGYPRGCTGPAFLDIHQAADLRGRHSSLQDVDRTDPG